MNTENADLFSVIIASYNRSGLIEESLNSVKNQTYRPIEVIVIDDGSTDNTKDVVALWINENFEDGGFSLKYFWQPNAGPCSARNKGIVESKGDYIQFLDSDDLISPDRFEILAKEFQETRADFIQTGFDRFDENSLEVVGYNFGRPNENQVELAFKGLLWANTLRSAFRRSLVQKIEPWDIKMTCFEDRLYVERAVFKATNPIAISKILASARRGSGDSLSAKMKSYEGRMNRIKCEQNIRDYLYSNPVVSSESLQEFASRIYALGFRSNAIGWNDLGAKCGEIAGGVGVQLSYKGKLRKLVWKTGRIGGVIYNSMAKAKRVVS